MILTEADGGTASGEVAWKVEKSLGTRTGTIPYLEKANSGYGVRQEERGSLVSCCKVMSEAEDRCGSRRSVSDPGSLTRHLQSDSW